MKPRINNHQNPDQGIRPKVLYTAVGSILVSIALVCAVKTKSPSANGTSAPVSPQVATEDARPVNSSASVEPATERFSVTREPAEPVVMNTDQARWLGATSGWTSPW